MMAGILVDFNEVMEDLELVKEIKREGCYSNFVTQSTLQWFRKAVKKQINYGSGCDESEINFLIIRIVDSKLFKNVTVITCKLQHNLVVVDVFDKENRMED